MNELQKKPLTHRTCIKSNHTFWKIFASVFLIAILLIPVIIAIECAPLSEEDMGGIFIGVLFGGIFAICGIILLIQTLKKRAKLAVKQYYIYLDIVAEKKIHRDDDSVSYVLHFANNKYTKNVSKKKYETTPVGTEYYLLQINGSKRAMAAFAESEYYLDESVLKRFRMF